MNMLPFLATDFLGQPLTAWLIFFVIIVALLAFDLGFANKGDHEIGIRRSLVFSAFYIAVALLFGGWVWYDLGAGSGMDYLTGFVVEKSLALDNIFVISLIFAAFAIPRAYQHRVLFWGIVGVVVLRAIMIGLGAALIANFAWILYVFGAFLLLTGVKMLFAGDEPVDIEKNRDHPLRAPLHPGHARSCMATASSCASRMAGGKHGADGDAALPRAGLDRDRRHRLRGRQRAGRVRDHDGSLHRLYEQHLRDPRPQRALFRARRCRAPLPLSEIRAGAGADRRRRQDLLGAPRRPGALGRLARPDHRPSRRRRDPVALEDARRAAEDGVQRG